jgi:hypothetical protein
MGEKWIILDFLMWARDVSECEKIWDPHQGYSFLRCAKTSSSSGFTRIGQDYEVQGSKPPILRIGSLSIRGLSWTPYGSSGFTVKLFLLDMLCLTIIGLTFGIEGLVEFLTAGFCLVILALLHTNLHFWKKLAARILWMPYARVRYWRSRVLNEVVIISC